jgi:hypothetical protein
MLALDAAAARIEEVAWVTDYLADLEADFLVHYGIDDMWSMPGPRFFRLAARTVAYRGVMQARAQALMDADEREADTYRAPAAQSAAATSGDVVRVIEPTSEAIAGSTLSDMIEVG